jgi:hypothetical protein
LQRFNALFDLWICGLVKFVGEPKHPTPALSPLPRQGNAEREKRAQRFADVGRACDRGRVLQ